MSFPGASAVPCASFSGHPFSDCLVTVSSPQTLCPLPKTRNYNSLIHCWKEVKKFRWCRFKARYLFVCGGNERNLEKSDRVHRVLQFRMRRSFSLLKHRTAKTFILLLQMFLSYLTTPPTHTPTYGWPPYPTILKTYKLISLGGGQFGKFGNG